MAKTYTAPTTVSAGDAVTASLYNTYVGTNVANLIVPPSCRVQLSSNKTFTDSTWGALDWGTAAWDTDSMFTAATNYIQINTAGLYQVSFGINFVSNSTFERIAYVTLNTATINGSGNVFGTTSKGISVTDARLIGSTTLSLAVNDRLRLLGYQNTAGNLATVNTGVENFLCATWIGRTS